MADGDAERVREALAAWAQPVLEADGGGLELVSVQDGLVTVRLRAACAGCPGTGYTVARVIRPAIAAVLERDFEVDVLRAPPLPTRRDR